MPAPRVVQTVRMRRRSLPTAVVTGVLAAVLLTGCGSVRDLAGDALGSGDDAGPCPTAGSAEPAGPGTTATPAATATLDPTVAREVADALRAVRALPGVHAAVEQTTNTPSTVPDPSCATRSTTTNHFASTFTVTTDPSATAAQTGAVPTTMAEHLAWTAVRLELTVPAADDHIESVVHYENTFDQVIPAATSTAVADGLATLAATPHVTGLDATIPYTMRVDYGSLTVGVDTDDPAVLDSVRKVIDTTAFAHTTLHGSFGNGAKP